MRRPDRVTSEPGCRSTFFFTVPVATIRMRAQKRTNVLNGRETCGDDNPTIRAISSPITWLAGASSVTEASSVGS